METINETREDRLSGPAVLHHRGNSRRHRPLITVLLVLALLLLPVADQAQPQPRFTMLEACAAIVVIGTLTLALICVEIYDHTGNSTNLPAPPTPPSTNWVPPYWQTNTWPVAISIAPQMPLPAYDVSQMGYADTNGAAACVFTNVLPIVLNVGDSPGRLHPLYRITAWMSANGRQVLFNDTNGAPLWTGYAPWGKSPYCPLTIGTGKEPARFFSLSPQ